MVGGSVGDVEWEVGVLILEDGEGGAAGVVAAREGETGLVKKEMLRMGVEGYEKNDTKAKVG